MACFRSFLAVSSAIFFIVFVVAASGTLEVTEPYPGTVVAIQGEQHSVTCVIINPENDTTHANVTRIGFYKFIDNFGGKELIVYDGKYSYEQKADYSNGVPRWNGTLIINNITKAEMGQYECRVRDTAAKYGFRISYIEKKDLPVIMYSQDKNVSFNDIVTLSCNLVKEGNKISVKSSSIAWFKGNTKLQEILYPEEGSLMNLTLNMKSPEDAGTYKCQLTSILLSLRNYTTTGTIHVHLNNKVQSTSAPTTKLQGETTPTSPTVVQSTSTPTTKLQGACQFRQQPLMIMIAVIVSVLYKFPL